MGFSWLMMGGFLTLWMATHFVVLQFVEIVMALVIPARYDGPNGFAVAFRDMTAARRANIRRLLRSFVYCTAASILGFILLLKKYEKYPDDLLLSWSDLHEVAFNMALGHWLFSIAEDIIAKDEVVAHLPLKYNDVAKKDYKRKLILHHVITVFAYTWILCTEKLSALGVFGLCFELPVLFMTAREFIIAFDDLFHIVDRISQDAVKNFYKSFYVVWHATRTLFCLYWPWSLIFWREYLYTIPTASQIVYHALAICFSYGNFAILFTVVTPSMKYDLGKWEIIPTEEEVDPEMAVAEEIKSLKLIGPRELAEHSNSDDLWFSINGKVYDVSNWIDKHPGGRDVLLDVAGRDATEAFTKAGHPQKVWKMMEAYRVGDMLPHGYEQTGIEKAEIDKWKEEEDNQRLSFAERIALREKKARIRPMGDTTKNFNLLDRYWVWTDPILPSVLLILGFLLLSHSSIPELSPPENEIAVLPIAYERAMIAATRVIMFSAILLLAISHSHIQRNILPEFLHFFIPASWIGPPSDFLKPNLFVPDVLLNDRIHFTSWAFIAMTFGLMVCLSIHKSWTVVRLSFTLVSFLEFMWESFYVIFVVPYGWSLQRWWGAMNLTLLCKQFTLSTESKKGIGKWLLFACVCLDMWHLEDYYDDFLEFQPESCTRNIFENIGGSIGLWNFESPCVMTHFPVIFWMFVIAICKKCIAYSWHAWASDRNGDNFGAVTGTTVLAAFYLFIYALVHGRLENILPMALSVNYINSFTWLQIFYAIFECLLFAVLFSLVNLSHGMHSLLSTPAYAIHTQCLTVTAILWGFGSSLGAARWYAFVLFLFAVNYLSRDVSERLEEAVPNAPGYWYRIKSIEESVRLLVSTTFFIVIVKPLGSICSFIGPYGYLYWIPPNLVVDMTGKGEYGVAMQVNGKNQREPTTFQCNVGYLSGETTDLAATVLGTKEMLKELANDPESGDKGFVTDVVCVFKLDSNTPAGKAGYEFREINFSAWADDKSAYNWYKNSNAHKEIVNKYYNAGLANFSSMLGRLKAPEDTPIRWEVRCRDCRRMVAGPKVSKCPYCEGEMKPMPYF